MASQLTVHDTAQRMRQFYALTKPRVTLLAVFCAVIGMFLATPGMVPWRVLFAGTAGIALLAGAAFAINCLIEQEIDAKMSRTRARPLPRGELTSVQTVVFAVQPSSGGIAPEIPPMTMFCGVAGFSTTV